MTRYRVFKRCKEKTQALLQVRDRVTGQISWALVKAQPILDAQGQVQFAVMVITDLTERKTFEQRKDAFLMNVSHELNTPLTALMGFLELLRDHQERLDPRLQAQFISQAVENCQELLRLVNSVLDALQASDAMPPAHQVSLALSAIVRDVIAQFDPTTIEAYPLIIQVPEDILVWADKQYLYQVLRNLLSNAFKYAPKHTPIWLSATRWQEPTGCATSCFS